MIERCIYWNNETLIYNYMVNQCIELLMLGKYGFM